MRIAFKEWAVVADALGAGRQILILRKGGISEGRGGFKMEWPEFLLFPTLFHQQGEWVVPEAQARFAAMGPELPTGAELPVTHFARVAEWRQLESLAAAEALEGQHILRPEVIRDRFEWGREKAIFAIAVRVFRLAAPRRLPMLPAYGGCKSWVELAEEFDPANATPALDDAQFAEALRRFRAALDPHAARGADAAPRP